MARKRRKRIVGAGVLTGQSAAVNEAIRRGLRTNFPAKRGVTRTTKPVSFKSKIPIKKIESLDVARKVSAKQTARNQAKFARNMLKDRTLNLSKATRADLQATAAGSPVVKAAALTGAKALAGGATFAAAAFLGAKEISKASTRTRRTQDTLSAQGRNLEEQLRQTIIRTRGSRQAAIRSRL